MWPVNISHFVICGLYFLAVSNNLNYLIHFVQTFHWFKAIDDVVSFWPFCHRNFCAQTSYNRKLIQFCSSYLVLVFQIEIFFWIFVHIDFEGHYKPEKEAMRACNLQTELLWFAITLTAWTTTFHSIVLFWSFLLHFLQSAGSIGSQIIIMFGFSLVYNATNDFSFATTVYF